jgi:hypothetical protein
MKSLVAIIAIYLGALVSTSALAQEQFTGIIVELGTEYDDYIAMCGITNACSTTKPKIFYRSLPRPSDSVSRYIPESMGAESIEETLKGLYYYVTYGDIDFMGISSNLTLIFHQGKVSGYSLSTGFLNPREGSNLAANIANNLNRKYGIKFGTWVGNDPHYESALIDANLIDGGKVVFQMERDYHPLSLARAVEEREPRFTITITSPKDLEPPKLSIDSF